MAQDNSQSAGPDVLDVRAQPLKPKKPRASLLPDRHPNRDLFICDIFDATPKGDMGSMEHPMFALQKNPDLNIRRYEHNGDSIEITPSVKGLATIWDRDVLIYCASQLVEAINRERQDVSRTVRVKEYDLLVATNRKTGGEHYDRLREAFERLAGTRVITNIKTNGVEIEHGFGWIDSWKTVKKSGRVEAVDITLSEWLYNAIRGMEVLTLNRGYFLLGRSVERALYLIARKHCGHQRKWKIGLKLLHKKTGSTGSPSEFRRLLKPVLKDQNLPDYRISYDKQDDAVTFYPKDNKGNQAQARDLLHGL